MTDHSTKCDKVFKVPLKSTKKQMNCIILHFECITTRMFTVTEQNEDVFLQFLKLLILSRVARVLQSIPIVIVQEAGCTTDRSTIYHRSCSPSPVLYKQFRVTN